MRLMVVDFLPSHAQMRKMLMSIVKIEFVFDVYLLCSSLITQFKYDDTCAANP